MNSPEREVEKERNRAQSNRVDGTCVRTLHGYVHLCDGGGREKTSEGSQDGEEG